MLSEETLAVVIHAAGDLRVEAVPLPAPAATEAIVDIAYGGICGSDLHYWTHGAAGESILREPMILGHEVVGTVVQAAADGSGASAGTPVAIHPGTRGTGTQRYPWERPNVSPGSTYLGSAAHLPHTQGAFAQRVVLPGRMLRPLPGSLGLRDAALAEPASVAWHAVGRAGDVAGKRVLVIGSGPIGCLVVAVLKRAGAAEIVAVDLLDKPLETACAVGATSSLFATDVEAIARVEADVVIESSGSPHGLAAAINGTMRGGRLVMVGLLPAGQQPVPIAAAITREIELVGSFRFNGEMDEVLNAMADGSLVTAPIVTHEFDLTNALEAFETAKNAAISAKVLLRF